MENLDGARRMHRDARRDAAEQESLNASQSAGADE
jgi:hypothetical protein